MKIQRQFISSLGALILACSLLSLEANAAVTVSAVERASIVEGSGTATITVYGGVAGDTNRCDTVASDSLCNNCRLLSTETVPNADPDQYLQACNNRRIHPDLQLVISLSSDAIDGRATVTNSDGNTAIATVSAPLTLAKGTTGQIVLRWGDLCARVISLDTNSGGEGATQCAPVNGHASASLRVGISSDGDDLLNAATDEYRTMTVIVRGTSGVSLATDCDDVATDSRICYFEMGPGDEKAIVRTLRPGGNSFPTGTNTTYKFLRFLFDTQGFNFVHLGSSSVDLPIEAADTTTFNVSPRRIEGLVNDTPYYFKIAAIDAAGNVGLYNDKDTDTDCQFSVNPADTTCRVVTPSEVVGVLDKTNCFIATAAYGSPLASELNVLRDFRDQVLMTTSLGRAFVRGYYAASPAFAKFILKNDKLRSLTRKALVPFVWFAGVSLSIGASATLWFLISLAIALTAVVHIVASRPKPRLTKQQGRKGNRDRSSWLPLVSAFTLGIAAGAPANAQMESLEDRTSTPIEALEDETPPPPEYPYPGSTDPTLSTATEPATETIKPKPRRPKKRASARGSKFSDTPTPTKSNGWAEKPKQINEDGDYIYDRLGDAPAKQYGKPDQIKFSGTGGREAPSTITQDGEFQYPVAISDFTGAGGLRFGMMAPPDIINPSNGLSFKDIYGGAELPALLFEYEYPLTKVIGRIGIKGETGIIATSAKGRFKNPARAGEIPEERFTFVMVPLQATVIYRFQFADDQWVVPFAEGGGGYYGIVELRDDSKAPKFGGSPVAVAAGGVNILLDWLDRQAVRQLDADYGINHVWLSLQYRRIIGLKEDLKVSSNLITAGFTFDF